MSQHSKTRRYVVTVDGKAITMLSLSGATPEQAAAYCRDIFGNRYQGIQEES